MTDTIDVETYLANLPDDRRAAIEAVRAVINANLPPGYEEGLQYGMPTWFVPKTRLADTYNGQPLALASLGSQKNYMALYLMSVYGDAELRAWFEAAYKAAGKKLDMGKACIRFKTLDALPLDVVGQAIAKVPVDRYIASYEAARANTAEGRAKAAAATEKPEPVASAKPSRTQRIATAARTASAAKTANGAKPTARTATTAKPAVKPAKPPAKPAKRR